MTDEQTLTSLLLTLANDAPLLYRGQIREWLLLRHPRTPQERKRGWQKYRTWKKRCRDQADRVIQSGLANGRLAPFSFGHFHHRSIVTPAPLLAVEPAERPPDLPAAIGELRVWLEKERNVPRRDLVAYYVPAQFDRPSLRLPLFRDVIFYAAANPKCTVGEPRIIEAFRIGSMYVSQFAYRPEDADTFQLSDSPFGGADELVPRAAINRGRTPARLFIIRENNLNKLSHLLDEQDARPFRIELW